MPLSSSRDPRPDASSYDRGLASLLEMAMRNAVEKLAAMLRVPLLVEAATVAPFDDARLARRLGDGGSTGVLLGIRGDCSGVLLMALESAALPEFARIVPSEFKQTMTDEGETVRYVLEEMANLLFSTYLDVFSDVASLRLLPTPPRLLDGTGAELARQVGAGLSASAAASGGPQAGGGRLLVANLHLQTPAVQVTVAAALPDADATRILDGARRCMPELFLI